MPRVGYMRRQLNDSGVITVYLLIILVAMFFFIGVLVDSARIMAAKKAINRAANASARSVLADYQPELKNYGLYGLNDPSKANTEFEGYLKQNLGYSEEGQGPTGFLDYRLDYSKIDTSSPLYDRLVLKQEILDEMKYKAPIEIFARLIDAFRSISKASGNFAQANDLASLQKKRDKAIKEATSKFTNLYTSDGSVTPIKNVKDKIDHYNAENGPRKKLEESWTLDRWESADFDDAIDDLSDKSDGAGYSLSKISGILSDIETDLNVARKVNADMVQKMAESKDFSLPETPNSQDIQELDTAQYDKPLVYRDEDFVNALSQIDQYKDIVAKIHASALLIISVFKDKDPADGDYKVFIDQSGEFYQDLIDLDLAAVKDLSFKIDNNQSKGKSDKEVTKDAESGLSNLVNLDRIKGEVEDQIEATKKLSAANTFFSAKYSGAQSDTDPEEIRDKATNLLTEIFTKLKQITYQSRDALFINEYALQKFNYYKSEQNVKPNPDPSFSSNHLLKSCEVEYLIYGKDTPAYNLFLAFSELFTVRLAINSVYHFVNTKGELVARLIASVVLGLESTLDDMRRLLGIGMTRPEPVNIVPKIKVQLAYQDYLRLFLLLHQSSEEGEDDKLKNIQSLISVNIDKVDEKTKPTIIPNAYTVINGEVKASVRLWFIPTIMSGIGHFAGYKVEGNRAIIIQKVTAAY